MLPEQQVLSLFNPFLQGNINEDDVAEARPDDLMIDSDQEDDEDIDI